MSLAIVITLPGLQAAQAQQTPVVGVGDYFFCDASTAPGDCVTTVPAGSAVTWSYDQGIEGHTVTACGQSCDSPTSSPAFDSGRLLADNTFSFTFDTPGTYLYYCQFHAVAMRGAVVVQETATSGPTEAPAATAPTTADPTQLSTPGSTPTHARESTPTATARRSQATTPRVTAEPTGDADGGSVSPLWFIIGGAAAAAGLVAAGVVALNRRT